MSAGVVGQGEAGRDALADRFLLGEQVFRDGFDDMLQRIEATVAELRHRHTAVTFQAVARKAGVSRTFLYGPHPGLDTVDTGS